MFVLVHLCNGYIYMSLNHIYFEGSPLQ